jgi:UPF0755 protein
MPDSLSDDPFADLFGKLPDPRSRELRSPDTGNGSIQPAAPASTEHPVNGDGAPLSRRAAREAAAAQSSPEKTSPPEQSADGVTTGSTAAPSPEPAGPASVRHDSVPTRTESAEAASRSGEPGSGFRPVPLRTPRPTAPIDVVESGGADPWIFGAAAASPALPYSRSGAIATIPATGTRTATGETGGIAQPDGDDVPSRTGVAAENGRRAATANGANAGGSAPTGSLDALFSGTGSIDEIGTVPPPKNKRRRRIGGWIALGVVLLLLGGIAGGGWYVWTTYEDKIREVMGWEEPQDFEAGLANGEAFVTIASGDTGSPISQKLYDAGVTKTPEAFYDYLIDSGQDPMFQPGYFQLQKQMTSEAALTALLDPANRMENTAQLREGLTVEQSLPLLADGTGIPLEELEAAAADPAAYGVSADSLEGWLFPATYTFTPEATATDVITTLVNRTIESLDAAGVPVEDRQRILTIASIIQREARYEADMQKVSTVIQNRLDESNQETFGKLQMDSTAQYGYGEMHDGTVSSSEEALNDPNPWNTYMNTGLPIGPISNPGDVAINAAMHPAEGPWLYFVTVNLDTGETVFTSTYSEHLKYVDQWQQWCGEHPDSGC